MVERNIVPSRDESLGEPLTPDQVLTKAEVDYRKALSVMAGCPGYEWLDEPSPSNWPPEKGIVHKLKGLLSEASFAIKYPHAHRAFKNLEQERRG